MHVLTFIMRDTALQRLVERDLCPQQLDIITDSEHALRDRHAHRPPCAVRNLFRGPYWSVRGITCRDRRRSDLSQRAAFSRLFIVDSFLSYSIN